MSSEAIRWARNQSFGSLSLKALVNAIAARADSKGCTWASQQTLARDLGASDCHVRTRCQPPSRRSARFPGRLGAPDARAG